MSEPRTEASASTATGTPAPSAPTGLRFRKRPIVIEAVQYTEKAARYGWSDDIPEWLDDAYGDGTASNVLDINTPRPHLVWLAIKTLEGERRCDVGDWIVRGVKGELYPCKPDIFELTYEPDDGAGHGTASTTDGVRVPGSASE